MYASLEFGPILAARTSNGGWLPLPVSGYGRLTCISHHPTVEAHDTTARASLRLLAVLNVLFKYACARQAACA
ncbi:MAG: hypothetical protein OXL36_15775 [Bryobacterales bacterium]|nr:hypothetical protein [Bryobacterales bacterium]